MLVRISILGANVIAKAAMLRGTPAKNLYGGIGKYRPYQTIT